MPPSSEGDALFQGTKYTDYHMALQRAPRARTSPGGSRSLSDRLPPQKEMPKAFMPGLWEAGWVSRGLCLLARAIANCTCMAAENAGCGSQKEVAREISAGTRSLCPNKPFKTKPRGLSHSLAVFSLTHPRPVFAFLTPINYRSGR